MKHFVSKSLDRLLLAEYTLHMNSEYFRAELSKDLDRRTSQNPLYSLRAYANFLNVSPATLSGILNGNRRPSLEMLTKISNALGWTKPTVATIFDDAVPEFNEEPYCVSKV